MALNKITYIDKLEIDKDGNIGIRMVYGIEQDGQMVTRHYHRTVLMNDVPAAAQMAVVNGHLTAMGHAQVGVADLAWLDSIAGRVKSASAGGAGRANREPLE